MTNNSLISLGELSKPATVLIKKISDAVGGLFKPYQIVRVAKAEAEADRISAKAEIEVTDLHRRAMRRFLEEEAIKQQNMEEITRQALPQLKEDSQPDKVEDDWITNFFDRCRLISDEQMQGLWSRVLAGEANTPGTYSKRTVNFLSDLDKADAELFTSLCGFACEIDGDKWLLIYRVGDEILNKHGIVFGALTHLDSIGLIRFDNHAEFLAEDVPLDLRILYYGTPAELKTDGKFQVGKAALSKIGQELAPICGSTPVEGFLDYARNKWIALGYIK